MVTLTTNYSLNKPAVNSATDEDLWGGYLNDNTDDIDSLLKTRTDEYNFADFLLTRPYIKDAAEVAYSVGNVSGAVTLDYTNGNYQYMTLTGNITSLTINNPPATGRGGFMTLEMIQDGTGSRTLTLDGAVYLTSANATITLTTTASAIDKLRLETRNAGTTWHVFPNLDIR